MVTCYIPGAWLMAPPETPAIPQEHGGCPEPIRLAKGVPVMAKNGEKHQNHLKWARRLIKMRRNTHDLVFDFFFPAQWWV